MIATIRPNMDGSVRRYLEPMAKPHIFKVTGTWIYSPATCENFKDRKEKLRSERLNMQAFNFVKDKQKSDRRERMKSLRKQHPLGMQIYRSSDTPLTTPRPSDTLHTYSEINPFSE